MINQGNNVPDNTIAIFADHPYNNIPKDRINNLIEPSPKKRDWFTPHFYRCLPLSIGNQYGFIVKSEYTFEFEWDGTDGPDAIKFSFDEDTSTLFPHITSHFGSGIITMGYPFALRTPPGVNLMTINPPNFMLHNITVMTGVIETDNLRRDFSFNLKVQLPGIKVKILAGYPLAAFIPIPRYYADNFKLSLADDIFPENIVIEEAQAMTDAYLKREEIELFNNNNVGRDYLKGQDVYGNKFNDHQQG
jgi:hypothetical protein